MGMGDKRLLALGFRNQKPETRGWRNEAVPTVLCLYLAPEGRILALLIAVAGNSLECAPWSCAKSSAVGPDSSRSEGILLGLVV